MAKANRAGAEGQLPRDDTPTVEGVHHDHHDSKGNLVEAHLHRLGNLRHDHLENGKASFADGVEEVAVTDQQWGSVRDGEYVEAPQPRDPATAGEDGAEWFNGDAAERARLEAERREIAARRGDVILPGDNGTHNGEARPMPGGSIGHIVAGTALEALYGTPDDVADEKTHGGLAAQLLFEVAETDWAHNRLGDAAKLIQIHSLFHHILAARNLLPTPAEVEAANGGGSA